MNEISTNTIVLLLVLSLPCIILGYLIAVKQWRQLIAGWDESKVENPTAFAKVIGGSLLFVGVVAGLLAIGKDIGLIAEVTFVCALALVVLMPILSLIIAHKKYGKRT